MLWGYPQGGGVWKAGAYLHPALPFLRLLAVEQEGSLDSAAGGDQCHHGQNQEQEGQHIPTVTLHRTGMWCLEALSRQQVQSREL
jgi:hypothetical protein